MPPAIFPKEDLCSGIIKKHRMVFLQNLIFLVVISANHKSDDLISHHITATTTTVLKFLRSGPCLYTPPEVHPLTKQFATDPKNVVLNVNGLVTSSRNKCISINFYSLTKDKTIIVLKLLC